MQYRTAPLDITHHGRAWKRGVRSPDGDWWLKLGVAGINDDTYLIASPYMEGDEWWLLPNRVPMYTNKTVRGPYPCIEHCIVIARLLT